MKIFKKFTRHDTQKQQQQLIKTTPIVQNHTKQNNNVINNNKPKNNTKLTFENHEDEPMIQTYKLINGLLNNKPIYKNATLTESYHKSNDKQNNNAINKQTKTIQNYKQSNAKISNTKTKIESYTTPIAQKYKWVNMAKGFHKSLKNSKEKRPNFFVLGTRKGGTTSFITYLSKHPKIYPFNINGNPQDGEIFLPLGSSQYRKKFEHIPKKMIVGDATVSRFVNDATRLAKLYAKTPMFVLLRDPGSDV